ncbi:MAG: ribonuclease III [Verrucomicrobiota bacterium]
MIGSLEPLQAKIGYHFQTPALLEQALTHCSCTQESPEITDNQRLEFLGDAVLSMILAESIFLQFPDEREGHLAQCRSVLAKGAFLADIARRLQLPEHLRMSESERNNAGHDRDAALEDALEAVIGAIYLDSDYQQTRECVLAWYGDLPSVLQLQLAHDNPKGRLQEWTQAQGRIQPAYILIGESGPGHAKKFEVEVRIEGQAQGHGTGSSKKDAEEAAARDALSKLGRL